MLKFNVKTSILPPPPSLTSGKGFFAVVFTIGLLFSACAQADTHIWVGNTDTNLATAGNWEDGTAPADGDAWQFGVVGSQGYSLTNNFTGGTYNSGIVFTEATTGSYTITGNWTRQKGDIVNNSSYTQTLNMGHEIRSSVTINAAKGDINILKNNSINLYNQKLTVTGDKNTTINLTISSGGTIVKEGTGTLELKGHNSFTGSFTISGGTLKASAGYQNDDSHGALGNIYSSKTITISKDSTLLFAAHDVLGSSGKNSGAKITANGGTIENVKGYFTTLRNTTLKNGGKVIDNSGDGDWKSFLFKGDLTISADSKLDADQVSTISCGTTNKNNGIVFDAANIIVNDVTKVSSDSDLIISSPLVNGKIASGGRFYKSGAGTLELSVANNYSGWTNINAGTLKLSGNGTLGTGTTTIAKDATLEFDVANGQTRKITFGGTKTGYERFYTITKSGTSTTTESKIVKSGDGDLKILLQAAGQISADKLIVSSGRLDISSALEAATLDANINVLDGATFSPGNSIGILRLATNDKITVEDGGKLLLEVGGTDASENDQIIGDGVSVVFDSGSILELAIDPTSSYIPQNGDIINFNVPGLTEALNDPANNITVSSYFFQLQKDSSGNWVIGVNPNAVPEPSTWALLVLGFAGLMWLRRKRERR